MTKKKHGNSLENDKLHHLYAIKDSEVKLPCNQNKDDVMKFGISDKLLNADGSSPRANEQVNFLNRAVGKLRFYAQILKTKIHGRILAIKLENQHIKDYENEQRRKPRGNQ